MNARHESTLPNQRWRFIFVVLAIVFVWIVVLPRLGQSSPMRGIIDRNQAASIDPTALFYTDLEHLHYEDGCLRRDS